MRLLVTGGAGYIGSHVVPQLSAAAHDVVVLDDLSSGHAWAVPTGRLVQQNLGDVEALGKLFEGDHFDAVLHLAAKISVAESVERPDFYFENNVAFTRLLIDRCLKHGIKWFVFSSTAAVYGTPDETPVMEVAPCAPVNPYGETKLQVEKMLAQVAGSGSMRVAVLRYFNVTGADPRGRIGQVTQNATHLVKVACETALGLRQGMELFGTDYPTPDGTCVRDFIHVEDLARAHVMALDYLAGGGESVTLNCGYGRGYSVREVIAAVKSAAKVDFRVREAGRRPGDPVALVAQCERIREVLDWRPRHDDLDVMVAHTLAWERKWLEMQGAAAQS